MQISFTTKPAAAKSKEAIALFTADAKKAGKLGTAIDKEIKGAVGRTLKGEAFDGKAGAVAAIYGTEAADQIVLVGLGEAEKLDAKAAMKAGGALAGHLNTAKLKSVEVQLDVPKGSALSVEELAANKVELLSCGRPTGRPLLFGLNEQSFVLAGDLSWRRVKTWACRFG